MIPESSLNPYFNFNGNEIKGLNNIIGNGAIAASSYYYF